jgi:hypothetical protein
MRPTLKLHFGLDDIAGGVKISRPGRPTEARRHSGLSPFCQLKASIAWPNATIQPDFARSGDSKAAVSLATDMTRSPVLKIFGRFSHYIRL